MELKSRRISADGRLGAARYLRFRPAVRRHGLHAYLGEWRLREHLPGVFVHIRIERRGGKPYVTAWGIFDGWERQLVRKAGNWNGRKILLRWRDRFGYDRKAVIEGVRPDRRGRFRRIRVRLYVDGRRTPVVYHLERIGFRRQWSPRP
jgi:hypothetical protein